MLELNMLHQGDCAELMRQLPAGCIDLVVADPPYNVGKAAWDKLGSECEARAWHMAWLAEAARALKPNGVLYVFHNDMAQFSRLLSDIQANLPMRLISFITWDKSAWYRKASWLQSGCNRRFFNVCEYVAHFAMEGGVKPPAGRAVRDAMNADAGHFRELIDWHDGELARLGLTARDVAERYTQATGKAPHMLRHYFKGSQFELPTREVWEAVYEPLGFRLGNGALRGQYGALRGQYDGMRDSYEATRYRHRHEGGCHNVMRDTASEALATNKRIHPTQKPVAMARRFIRASSGPGEVVLDPFAGSGTTAVAAIREGRRWITFEKDPGYARLASERIRAEAAQMALYGYEAEGAKGEGERRPEAPLARQETLWG